MTNERTDLLDCPFCGGEAQKFWALKSEIYSCADDACPGYGANCTPEQWNTRTTIAPSTADDMVAVPRDVMEELWTKAQEIGYHAEMDVLKGKRRGHWIKPVAYEAIALLQPYTKGEK